MCATIDPGVCATADDGTEIYPAEGAPEFCISSDVSKLEEENSQLKDDNSKLKERIAELEEELNRYKQLSIL